MRSIIQFLAVMLTAIALGLIWFSAKQESRIDRIGLDVSIALLMFAVGGMAVVVYSMG